MSLRVATWNLGHQTGDYWARLEAIIETLKRTSPDVVCCQEVWADEDGVDQAEVLADALSLHMVRTPKRYWHGKSFGNAVLSREPLTRSETVALVDVEGKTTARTALFASFVGPDDLGEISVVSVHFEHRFDRSLTRQAQGAQLCAHSAQWRGEKPEDHFPLIVGGDLNALPDSDEIRSLTGRSNPPVPGFVFTDAWEIGGAGAPGYTWCASNPMLENASWPNRRLDYLLLSWPRRRGIGVPVSISLFGVEAIAGVMPSDHYGVVADLRSNLH